MESENERQSSMSLAGEKKKKGARLNVIAFHVSSFSWMAGACLFLDIYTLANRHASSSSVSASEEVIQGGLVSVGSEVPLLPKTV